MRHLKQIIKKAGFLLFPIIILLGMTNCSQFQSFSESDGVKFLSENPVFSNTQGNDPNDDGNRPPVICITGYTLNDAETACVPITCPAHQILVGNNCQSCPSGKQPNTDQTACVDIICTGNRILVGNNCQACPAGEVSDAAKTACVCPVDSHEMTIDNV